MGLAAHAILRQEVLPYTDVTSCAVENRPERRRIYQSYMQITVPSISLVLRSRVVVHALIPLPCITAIGKIFSQIIYGAGATRVRRRIHLENVLCHGIYLIRTEHIVLPITRERLRTARVRLIQLNWVGGARQRFV